MLTQSLEPPNTEIQLLSMYLKRNLTLKLKRIDCYTKLLHWIQNLKVHTLFVETHYYNQHEQIVIIKLYYYNNNKEKGSVTH